MSNAIVELNKEGQVLTVRTSAAGNEYGTLMVSQETYTATDKGFKVSKRYAFIPVFEADMGVINTICKAGQAVPFDGKIVRTETTVEQYQGQQPVINPTSGEVHMVNGSPIYRQDLWAGVNDSDTIISFVYCSY